MKYTDQLKDERWLKKRQEAIERDNYTCQLCFKEVKKFNVHHKKYIDGKKAWEYDVKDLISLCPKCHKDYHKEQSIFRGVNHINKSLSNG